MKKESDHLYFIDNIKIALIMLVVAHHAGQAYGPGGWWYFLDDESINWLGRFFSVNAAFFMSMFFFLSAYFLPQSIARKGPKRFLKERLIRIGIPLLLGFLVIIPILMYLYYINFRDYEPISFFSYYVNIFFGLGSEPTNWSGPSWPDMQFGHLWFLEHLLVYAVVFSVWTFFTSKKSTKKFDGNIKVYQILSLWLIVSLVTFITRIWFPIDHWTAFRRIYSNRICTCTTVCEFLLFRHYGLSSQMVFNFECESRIHLAYYWSINSNYFVFWREYGRSFSFKGWTKLWFVGSIIN